MITKFDSMVSQFLSWNRSNSGEVYKTYANLRYYLKTILNSHISDDDIMTKIYLYRTNAMNTDSILALNKDDIGRITKSVSGNIRCLYETTILGELDKIYNYLRNNVKMGTLYTIPVKVKQTFREYLNIISKYGSSFNSEALSNLSWNLKSSPVRSTRICNPEDVIKVSTDDLNILLNQIKVCLDSIRESLKEDNGNTTGVDKQTKFAYAIRHMLLFCRMIDHHSNDDEELHRFICAYNKELISPYIVNDTSIATERFKQNHVLMLNRDPLYRELFPRVKFTDEAALLYVVMDRLFNTIDSYNNAVSTVQ